MANIYLGDLIQTGKLAYSIYKKSYDENLRVDKQCSDFFDIIKTSSSTIERLEKVINDAVGQCRHYLDEDVCEDSCIISLREIIGDYKTTITECDQLLERSRPYFHSKGGFSQLRYNITVQKDVERLTFRIDVFISKVTFLLKPLEIDILNRIFQRVHTIEEIVRQIRGYLVGDINPETARQLAQQQPVFLPIPDDLRGAFEEHARTVEEECFKDGVVLIPKAADAIAFYLRYSTRRRQVDPDLPHEDRVPSTPEYLNLLKCVWLLEHIEEYDFSSIGDSSHWPGFFYNLRNETSRQCRRFLPGQNHDSDLSVPTPLKYTPKDCIIWHVPESVPLGPVFTDSLGMMDEIPELKDVRLLAANSDTTLTMRLFRGSESRFQVLFIAQKQSRQGKVHQETSTIEFSARTVKLIPLYAHPSRKDGYTIELKSEFKSTPLKFVKEKDARTFQQAITGYKVYYSHGPVGVSLSYTRPAKEELRRAFLQLWIPRELNGAPSSAQDVDEELRTQTDVRFPPPRPQPPLPPQRSTAADADPDAITPAPPRGYDVRYPPQRQPSTSASRPMHNRNASLSNLSLPSSPSSVKSRHGIFPHLKRRDSAQSSTFLGSHSSLHKRGAGSGLGSSGDSFASLGAKTVTVLHHGSSRGLLHRRPLTPMLVLFLHDISSDRIGEGLSIITIQLDFHTGINYERCDCKKLHLNRVRCDKAVIEYKNGESEKDCLHAQIYNAHELSDFDVTGPGVEKRRELPANKMDSLHRVSIIFPPQNGTNGSDLREVFGGHRCKCKIRTQKDLEACQRAVPTHRGKFGDVKDIGLEELRDYMMVQNMRQDIVLS